MDESLQIGQRLELGAPEPWDLSCPDWRARIRAGRSLMPALPLDQGEATMAVNFFDELQLPDVHGKPFLRDACGDWFRDVVRALFGAWIKGLQVRMIEEIFVLVPKKNSKTTYGAALMLVALLMNLRPRAEFLFVGPTHAISELAFTQAGGMVEANPEMGKRFHVREHLKQIDDRLNGSRLRIKTFDLDILTGPRPAGALLDEVHLLGRMATAGKVLRQLRGGRQSSPESFLVMLTTQSDDPPGGVFKAELAAARAIRDGKTRGTMLPLLYEFPETIAKSREQWEAVENWPMVMPNLGRSLNLARLRADYEFERDNKGEEAIRIWCSQHLNIEIGVGLGSNHWAGAVVWEPQTERDLTLPDLLARCDVCVAGVDGGGLDDLMSLGILGREIGTRHWLFWTHSWAHAIVLERRKDIAAKLQDFAAAGDLTIVTQLGDDITELVEIIKVVDDAGLLAQVGLDPVGIGAIVDALADVDVGGPGDPNKLRVVGVSQGWKLSGAVKTAERKLADGTMWHGGQPIMAWAVGNARTEQHGNATLITKQVSGSAKIDNVMALLDCCALMAGNPQAPKRAPNVDDFLANAVVA